MYYVMKCLSPDDGELAMLTYKRDHPMRSWASGRRFVDDPTTFPALRRPPEPVVAEVAAGYSGIMAEMWQTPVPLMTKRLHQALLGAGVDNVDVYAAEIIDPATGKKYSDYVAFNIVGKIAAADLQRTQVAPNSPDRMISMDVDSLAVDEGATHGALMFRLAESVNAILVHERVRQQIEGAGINTLTFIEPEQWAG